MMDYNKHINNYFLILFSIIPITLMIGSAASIVNILLIDFSFIFLIIYKNNFSFLKNKAIIFLFIIYVYLIFNSLISLDFSKGFFRNFGFLRIIVLFAAFNYFFNQKTFKKKMFNAWLIIMLIVMFDVFFEYINGKNILGFGSLYGNRIVSFFKDEPIVGGFINSFFLILIGFYIDYKKRYNYFIYIFIILTIIAIFLTGERSNSIKALLGLLIFFLLYKEVNFKLKFSLFFIIFIMIYFSLSNSAFLKNRFTDQILDLKKNENIYFDLYKSGFQVFKNNKFFGVGNKNYRIETCEQNKNLIITEKSLYVCSTHPHQIFFELLSEHGLVGTLIILLMFYKLIFSKIPKTILEKNYLKIGSLIYLVLTFLPLLPSGSFFNDYVLTLFAINLSIFFASDKKMNIFNMRN